MAVKRVFLHDSCRALAPTRRYPEVCDRCMGRVVNTITRLTSEDLGENVIAYTEFCCVEKLRKLELTDMCYTCQERVYPLLKAIMNDEWP